MQDLIKTVVTNKARKATAPVLPKEIESYIPGYDTAAYLFIIVMAVVAGVMLP